MTCPHCRASVGDGARFCPACGQVLASAALATAAGASALTGAADEARTVSATPSGSGWLTGSGSIDHGQFLPGVVLDGRYRIVGLLGRGGMGEVYRADDLRLGQSVALKFLPPSLSRDAQRLAQFHNEVRTARQVSHANVCRVYDIGEVGHQIYLSMEYVDGEDLASLLRRIGRLPEDKALEIARQICAGLAAAHERGVIHRDLKPANIMLDGSGRARIMDFSLAAVGDVTDIRSGTPAYMAPEQLSGKEVTARSDLYALGLVLYELFTGRRAYEAKSIGELVALQASGSITAPTDVVKSLDPAIERAILRCLEDDPARRPATALAVAASLPGGDPLAAAVAAGETPSPAMVAAAGGDAATVSPLAGTMWLAMTAVLLLATASVSDRVSLLVKTPFAKPPAVLVDRAEQIRESLGYTDTPADTASDFAVGTNYFVWAARQGAGRDHWAVLASGRPAAVWLWYRTSPGALVPAATRGPISLTDPPESVVGMTSVVVDTLGRLLAFQAVPPEVETVPAQAPVAADWTPLFTAASLDPKTFTDATPEETPPTYADERHAWAGLLPGTTEQVHLEAAAYRGRITYFHVFGPWTLPSRRMQISATSGPESTGNVIVVLALLVIAAVLARANLRSGRADRRGAFRLAAFATVLTVCIWASIDHVRSISDERDRFFDGVAIAMFVGAAMYLVYLALEPFVRRGWPGLLVGWSRVLGGQWRDAIVGRDLLLGVVAGAGYALLGMSYTSWSLGHQAAATPWAPDISMITSVRHWLLALFGSLNTGMQSQLFALLIFMLFRELVRLNAARLGRRSAAIDRASTVFAVVASILISSAVGNNSLADAVYSGLATLIELLVLIRLGLFASCVMLSVTWFLRRAPLTLDGSRFYAWDGWSALALILAVAIIGFWLARADEPVFGAAAADPRRHAA